MRPKTKDILIVLCGLLILRPAVAWLDAENHPHIKIRLTEVGSWKEVASTDSFAKYEAEFSGEVEIDVSLYHAND